MRIPRDISGQYLAQKMSVFGYRVTRQKGSHIRLSTQQKGEHHITIPAHKNLRVGTISTILFLKSIDGRYGPFRLFRIIERRDTDPTTTLASTNVNLFPISLPYWTRFLAQVIPFIEQNNAPKIRPSPHVIEIKTFKLLDRGNFCDPNIPLLSFGKKKPPQRRVAFFFSSLPDRPGGTGELSKEYLLQFLD